MQIKIDATSVLDKYPARQHALRAACELRAAKGLIYLAGSPTRILEDSDQARGFRQRRYFYYLSGVDEIDCHLTYDIEQDQLTLWLPPIDPVQVVWVGRGSNAEEALDKYDVDFANYSDGLPKYLSTWTRLNKESVYVLHPDQKPPILASMTQIMSSRYNTDDLRDAVDRCRIIKDDHEVALIRRANEISTLAHTAVLRKIRDFTTESQVEALYIDVCVVNGAKHQSYSIIAGSGENAAVLHYGKNDEPFGDRELMVLDAGAEYHCYSSDVTRTFPLADGYWPSEEAKEIYALVQLMQTAALNTVKPGAHWLNAQALCHQIAVEGLLKLGILHNGTNKEILEAGTSRAFFPHGLGHHMGLEVHDLMRPKTESASTSSTEPLSDAEEALKMFPLITNDEWLKATQSYRQPCTLESETLQPGMVITCEPGIYFNKYALDRLFLPHPVHSKYINKKVLDRYMKVGGVRIEDDILITRNGYEMLTTTPKGEEALRIIRGEA